MPDITAEEVQQIRKAYEGTTGTAEEDVIALCDTIDHLTFERDALRALCESAEAAEGKVLWRGPLGVLIKADSYGLAGDLPPGTQVAVVLTGGVT